MRRQIDGKLLEGLSDELNKATEKQWQTYQCTLVTPMYGGGVEASKVDTNMPIRASSIRGQLRFWWRIACGPKDPNELFKKEKEIWGGIGDDGAMASQVEIRVQSQPVFDKDFIKSNKYYDGIKYIFGSASINGAVDWLKDNYKFTLFIRYNDAVKRDVEEALRWWCSFGGIGGRTRRGFGAVSIENVDLITAEHPALKRKDIEIPRLKFSQKTFSSAQEAWKYAAERLFEFRQKPGSGRNNSSGKAGRSFWPEADQLRHLTGKNDNKRHMPEFEKNLIFPRAAFGMPIKFQFPGKNNDPDDMTLQPIDSERMASPLIIRPYKDGEKWRAAALLLPHWEKALVEPLELRLSSNNKKVTYQVNHWPDENQQAERDRLTNDIKGIKPMKGRPNDPLSAFLDYFEKGQ